MAADASSQSTNDAGSANHDAPSRPGTNARSAASGHGTRPIHAATAHVPSASAMPMRGRDRSARKLDQPESGEHPARPLPARRSASSARIASFLADVVGAWRASAISTDVCASASGSGPRRNRPLPLTGSTGKSAVSANAGVAGWPSRAAPKQQQRVGPRRLVMGARGRRGLARERGFDFVERALQRRRSRAFRTVENVTVDERLQLRFRRFDGVARGRADRPVLRAVAGEDPRVALASR